MLIGKIYTREIYIAEIYFLKILKNFSLSPPPSFFSNNKDKPTSAGIVLDEELIERDPTSSNSNHHGRAQDSNQAQLLWVSKLKG